MTCPFYTSDSEYRYIKLLFNYQNNFRVTKASGRDLGHIQFNFIGTKGDEYFKE